MQPRARAAQVAHQVDDAVQLVGLAVQNFVSAAVGMAADKAADVEAAAAVNGGRDAAYKSLLQTGKVVARKWMTCRDARVRDEHRRAHNQVAWGDAPFVVGGEECAYPGDPSLSAKNRCRCRCVSVSIGG